MKKIYGARIRSLKTLYLQLCSYAINSSTQLTLFRTHNPSTYSPANARDKIRRKQGPILNLT